MTPARLIASCLLCSATAAPACVMELAALPATDSLLILERTSRQLSHTKDPIWDLQLITAGEQIQRFDAVTGRAHRQTADRHIAGTRAPLPVGRYSLGPIDPAIPRSLGRSGSASNRSSPLAGATSASTLIPVPSATPTAAPSTASDW